MVARFISVDPAVIDSYKELMAMMSKGQLAPLISKELPLEKAVEGVALVRDRKATGKVIITVAH